VVQEPEPHVVESQTLTKKLQGVENVNEPVG